MTPVPVVIAFGYFGFVESHFPSQPQKLTWGQVVKLIVINLEPLGKLSAAFQLMTCWFRTSSVFRSQTKNRCKWAPWCMNPFTCQTSGFVGSPPLNKFSPQLKSIKLCKFRSTQLRQPLAWWCRIRKVSQHAFLRSRTYCLFFTFLPSRLFSLLLF